MQRKLKDYLQKCTEMCDKLNIPISHNIEELSVSHAEHRWGRTSWKNINGERQHFKISISYHLINPKHTETDDGLINTMIHELLHTCPDCKGHGAKWKAYADMIYQHYGINIKRADSSEEKKMDKQVMRNTYKYIVQCEKCGAEYGRYKMSPVIEYCNHYRCGTCKGKLIRVK